MVKNLPAVRETWIQSLDREDPLEKEMATHSSILGWKIPWTEKPGGIQSMGSQRLGHNWVTNVYSIKYGQYLEVCCSEGKNYWHVCLYLWDKYFHYSQSVHKIPEYLTAGSWELVVNGSCIALEY